MLISFEGLYRRQYGMPDTAGNKRPLAHDLDPAVRKIGRKGRPESELHTLMLDPSVGWNEFSKFMRNPANSGDLMDLALLQLQKIVRMHPIRQENSRGLKKGGLVDRIMALLRM